MGGGEPGNKERGDGELGENRPREKIKLTCI